MPILTNPIFCMFNLAQTSCQTTPLLGDKKIITPMDGGQLLTCRFS